MKKNSIKFKTLFYLILFSVLILALLWIVQVQFLSVFYEKYQIASIKNVANKIVTNQSDNFAIENYAYENNKPVLGICMGAESIDVFSLLLDSIEKNGGEVTREKVGTYYKTIKEKYGSTLRRLDPGNIHNNNIIDGNIEATKHEITIVSNTIASKIFPDKILVPSMHNYDFHAVGSHFKVSAKASDGVSEIIECVDPNKFIFGVHFHPELIKTEVFNYFIDRVKNS